jgi:hypothetical protein
LTTQTPTKYWKASGEAGIADPAPEARLRLGRLLQMVDQPPDQPAVWGKLPCPMTKPVAQAHLLSGSCRKRRIVRQASQNMAVCEIADMCEHGGAQELLRPLDSRSSGCTCCICTLIVSTGKHSNGTPRTNGKDDKLNCLPILTPKSRISVRGAQRLRRCKVNWRLYLEGFNTTPTTSTSTINLEPPISVWGMDGVQRSSQARPAARPG